MLLVTYNKIVKEMEKRSSKQQLGHMLHELAVEFNLCYSTIRGM